MPGLAFVTVDVFTTTRFAGNPLAIVRIPPGHEFATEQMQTIAREFNLSETIFLHENDSKSNDQAQSWRVRIFMPTSELPFAGHPTIGAACYALGTLANNSPKGRLVCNAGPIEIDFAAGVATASIPHNVRVHSQQAFTLEQVYALQPVLKNASKPPLAVDVISPVHGMNFVAVQLPDLETLDLVKITGIRPAPRLDGDWVADKNAGFVGMHYYTIIESSSVDGIPTVKVRARMLEAAFEDPATGSASCGLACYLAMKAKKSRVTKFEITQGVEMGRKSDIGVTVTLKENLEAVEKVDLSGIAVKVMEGVVEYH